ncbi:MAG: flagellar basal body protein [Bryobacteraceae bacterium]|jgi:flagellar basal-body rod protein FlgB
MLDPVAGSLERYMDLLAARQKLVASNIANAETPGYRTVDIDFESEFRSLVEGGQPRVVEVAGLEVNHDGNNVSLDREARMLAENGLRFDVAETLLKSQVQSVREAISGGGGG